MANRVLPPSRVISMPCRIEPLLGISRNELSVCQRQDWFSGGHREACAALPANAEPALPAGEAN